MIDWFPPTSSTDPAKDLAVWQGTITMRRVARAIDARHPSTDGHSDRVSLMAVRIAGELGWGRRAAARMRDAGAIHDIGKVCIPESILLTPGTLSPEDYEIVKTHAAIGARIAETVLSRSQVAWIRHHHERWDGRGYPDRLSGEEIPAGAAVLAVADAWDAMTSRSWSRAALTRAQALEECERESGRQFAPWAVEALGRVLAGERADSAEASPEALPAIRFSRLRLISAA